MNGVAILNEFEVLIDGYALAGAQLIFTIVLFLLGLGCCGAVFYLSIKEKSRSDIIVAVIFFVVFLGFMCPVFLEKPEYETQYEVCVTEETSMNDFFDKYELIEKRGLIYTVKEKEANIVEE